MFFRYPKPVYSPRFSRSKLSRSREKIRLFYKNMIPSKPSCHCSNGDISNSSRRVCAVAVDNNNKPQSRANLETAPGSGDQVDQGQHPGTAASLRTGVSENTECDQVSFLIRGILFEVHVSRSGCHRAHRNMYRVLPPSGFYLKD